MYANKMAVAIKTNGRVLKEFKDTVYVKFGSEYSVYMKNLNTTRALVNVYIDGTDITPGGLVINAGQEVDLQRSIANGNLMEGNALKFIERTGAVEQHRGIKLEDGLIRIEYQFEMPRMFTNISDNFYIKNSESTIYPQGGILRNSTNDVWPAGSVTCSATYDSYSAQASYNETGITVPGSKSEQKFQTTTMGALDTVKHSIVLKILGETPDNELVRKPVTVKTKQKCITCNHTNKISAKFCTECGTALEIFA